MSFADDAQLIAEYNAWISERRRLASDLTPESFLVDRAKGDAMEKLIAVDFVIQQWLNNDISGGEAMVGINDIVRGDGE